MARLASELIAALVLEFFTAWGAILGDGTAEAIADISTAVALLGLGTALMNALTRELAAMRARFGCPVLFAVLQMD